jgi:hypothetical protein
MKLMYGMEELEYYLELLWWFVELEYMNLQDEVAVW